MSGALTGRVTAPLNMQDPTAGYDRHRAPVQSKPINLMSEKEFAEWLEESNRKSRIENPQMTIK